MGKLKSFLFALVGSCFFATSVFAGVPLDRVVAIVNNQVISYSELKKQVTLLVSRVDTDKTPLPPKKILEQQVLSKMINDTLQLQLAKKTGIEVDSTTVNQALKDIAQQDGMTLDEYRMYIEQSGISFHDYREIIRTEVLLSRLQQREILQDISISETDIDSYLNSPVGQDQSGVEYRLGHILLLTPESPTPDALQASQTEANTLVNTLNNGADFRQVAMEKSAGHQALQGGDLGLRSIGEVPTLFVKHVPSMRIGEVVGPIRSANGFHIIKLIEKRIGKEPLHVETRVRQIFIKPSINTSDEEAASALKQIRADILNGADFSKMAEKKSEELSTATKGGELGWVTEKSVLPKFYHKMNKLKEGELSLPFKTEIGWHLIQVLERRTQNDSQEAARNRAKEVLQERKFSEMLGSWLKRIKDGAQIENLLDENASA